MRRKKLAIISAVLACAAGAAGFFVLTRGRADRAPEAELKSAPQFALHDYAGTEIKSSDFAGKPVVVISWASWCTQLCSKELKRVAAIKKGSGDGFSVVAINRGEAPEIARAYSDALGINSPAVFLLDPDDAFYKLIGGFSMPETLFISAEGRIKYHARGLQDQEELRRRIQDVM